MPSLDLYLATSHNLSTVEVPFTGWFQLLPALSSLPFGQRPQFTCVPPVFLIAGHPKVRRLCCSPETLVISAFLDGELLWKPMRESLFHWGSLMPSCSWRCEVTSSLDSLVLCCMVQVLETFEEPIIISSNVHWFWRKHACSIWKRFIRRFCIFVSYWPYQLPTSLLPGELLAQARLGFDILFGRNTTSWLCLRWCLPFSLDNHHLGISLLCSSVVLSKSKLLLVKPHWFSFLKYNFKGVGVSSHWFCWIIVQDYCCCMVYHISYGMYIDGSCLVLRGCWWHYIPIWAVVVNIYMEISETR